MKRRFACFLIIASLLVAALPQAALATTAQEMLFGDNSQVAAVDNNAIYGSGASGSGVSSSGIADLAAAAVAQSSDSQYPLLQLGDSDGDDGTAYVVFLQNRLRELGYLQDNADGTYGENTVTAVRQFQKNNALPETGIADSATQNRIYQDTSTLVMATADNSVFGSDVTRVQSVLSQWGFMQARVDGTYGDNTAKAIVAFKKYMVAIDPTFGQSALPAATPTPTPSELVDMPVIQDEVLTTVEGVSADSIINGDMDTALLQYTDGTKPFNVYRYTVQKGDKGDEVWRVQRRLHQLRYLYKPDGAYGNLTTYAIKYFQRKCGMKQTGVADEKTQRALFSNNAPEAEEYVFPYKVWVDVSDQRVYIGKWTGKDYSKLVKKFKCSTGKKGTPTPLGTYQADGKANGKEWYYMKSSSCYVKWATRIVGGVMFHSVIFGKNKKGPTRSSVAALGTRASHGCIRLSISNAKWIFDHIPQGTTVVIRK